MPALQLQETADESSPSRPPLRRRLRSAGDDGLRFDRGGPGAGRPAGGHRMDHIHCHDRRLPGRLQRPDQPRLPGGLVAMSRRLGGGDLYDDERRHCADQRPVPDRRPGQRPRRSSRRSPDRAVPVRRQRQPAMDRYRLRRAGGEYRPVSLGPRLPRCQQRHPPGGGSAGRAVFRRWLPAVGRARLWRVRPAVAGDPQRRGHLGEPG